MDRRYHKGLIHRYDGPFKMKRVGNVACRLRLSDHFKVHLTFRVSFLKPFHEDEKEGESKQRKHRL